MDLGTVVELWRHPVKSMQGERISAVSLTAGADVPGDRVWAVRDEERGGIRGGRALPGLLRCSARLPGDDVAAPPVITLPDGAELPADAPDAAERLSACLGRQVTLHPRRPASDVDHYRRGRSAYASRREELRTVFGLDENEALPDFSRFPAHLNTQLREFETPLGTYVDAMPLLVVTRASLRRLAELSPGSQVDVRRFRPNLVLESPGDGFVEQAWIGQRLRMGDATVEMVTGCPRCVMITRPFADLPEDRDLLRAVNRHADHNVGVYASVVDGGPVRVGDPVRPA